MPVKRASILLIHGGNDRFIPCTMSQNIHAAAPDKIGFHTIPGAGRALNYAAAPETYQVLLRVFERKTLGE